MGDRYESTEEEFMFLHTSEKNAFLVVEIIIIKEVDDGEGEQKSISSAGCAIIDLFRNLGESNLKNVDSASPRMMDKFVS